VVIVIHENPPSSRGVVPGCCSAEGHRVESTNASSHVETVLVYDDICTTGGQLDAVAGCLHDQGGAARVEGVVLARAPWRGF
jgi:predicted amidophosphoribosyltransferase